MLNTSADPSQIRPLEGEVLCKIALTPAYSPQKIIYIPKEARKKTDFATVIRLGAGIKSLSKGDIVIIDKGKGRPVYQHESQYDYFNETNEYILVSEDDIACVIEKGTTE